MIILGDLFSTLKEKLIKYSTKKCNIIVALLATCVLSGCASTEEGAAATECGVGAAATTYLVCKLKNGTDKQCAEMSAIVGLGGATICYTYAENLKKRKQELAGKENDLNARLQYVREANADAEKLNQQLQEKLTHLTQQTNEITSALAKQELTTEQLTQERESLDSEIKKANDQLTLSKNELNDMKLFRTKQTKKVAELDLEIAKQQKLYDRANSLVSAMEKQRERIG